MNIARQISVVMSVYNGASHLRESVDSILAQTFTDFEFIIIDDASTDESSAIINEYAAKDERIRVLTNDSNVGLAAALNNGLRVASGEYIARHDGDDVSLPDRLGVQFEYMESHPAVFLLGAASIVIDEGGEETAIYRYTTDEETLRRNLPCENQVQHPSMMFRNDGRHFYREKFRYAQDCDFLLRLLTEGKRIMNIPDVLIKHRMARAPLPSRRGAQQALFSRKARTFYRERTSSGTDCYDSFDPAPIMELDINETSDPLVLEQSITLYLRALRLPETRTAIECYWKHCGYVNKYTIIWAGTLLGKGSLTALQCIRRKLRREGSMFPMEKAEHRSVGKGEIALFSTNGSGLGTWEKVGTLSREVALYKRMSE